VKYSNFHGIFRYATGTVSKLGQDLVLEICALLGCYAGSSGGSVPTFRDNLSVPSSRVLGLLDPSIRDQ
jgi:hypothetical protein